MNMSRSHQPRWAAVHLIVAAALAVVATSCTGTPTSVPSSPSASASTVVPEPNPTTTGYPPASGYLRACGTDVVGTLAPYQIRQAVKAGPLAFVWVHDAALMSPNQFRHRPGGYFTGKYLVLVQSGQQVTVRVPAFELSTVALLYDPSRFAPVLPVRAGERTVTFRACPGSTPGWGYATQFNGGIIVAGARCVVLDVQPAASGQTYRVRMPFGRGTRCG